MKRRIDEDDVIRLLSQAGRDVELDRSRILDIVEGRSESASAAAGPRAPRPARRPEPVRPAGSTPSQTRRRASRRLLAIPLAAAMAGGAFVAVHAAVAPQHDRIRVVGDPETSVARPPETTPAPTTAPRSASRLGPAKSITSAPAPVPTPAGSTAAGSAAAVEADAGVSVTVAPAGTGTAHELSLQHAQAWLLTNDVQEPVQPHAPEGDSSVGPAQGMGSGHSVANSPYNLSWDPTTTGSGSGTSQQWLVAPAEVRGVPAGLRIPVRARHTPATITLFTGTVRGSGQVQVQAFGRLVKASLPDCSQGPCPAIVTITLDPPQRRTGTAEVLIELNATGKDAGVGLAAVELS